MANANPQPANIGDLNFIELARLCHDKESSVRFLQNLNLLSNPRHCDQGHAMSASFSDKNDRWRCSVRACRAEKGFRIGTFFDGAKIPFEKAILFIYCWAHELTSIKFIEREVKINHSTIVDWNNYLREVCAMTILDNPVEIGGQGEVVEIDESVFSRRKYHRGQQYPEQWVFGGYCRRTRESFLYTIPDRSAATLMPIIRGSIRAGTIVISDQWRAYNNIAANGFQHFTVNHSLNFVDPNTGAHTQGIESTWRNAKMRNKRHFGTSRGLLDSYLCEFMWRRRLEMTGADPFVQILADIAQHYPAPA